MNLYSHFSGSEIDSSSFAVPHDSATMADRIGPFQHFALHVISITFDKDLKRGCTGKRDLPV